MEEPPLNPESGAPAQAGPQADASSGGGVPGDSVPILPTAIATTTPSSPPGDDSPQTIAKKRVFLEAIVKAGGVIRVAARKAKISRSTHYEWLKADTGGEGYVQAFAIAMEDAADLVEEELVRRATKGTLKPVFYKGAECGKIREYSDTLMALLIRARKPESYRERHDVKLTGPPIKLYAGIDPDKDL